MTAWIRGSAATKAGIAALRHDRHFSSDAAFDNRSNFFCAGRYHYGNRFAGKSLTPIG